MSHKSDGRDEATRDREAYSVYDLLQSGWKPKPSDYAGAPILSNWRAVKVYGGIVLVGHVEGHPTLGPGDITTSALLAIDPDNGWCRTYGRYYRLGPRYTAEDVQEIEDGGVWDKPYFPDDDQEDQGDDIVDHGCDDYDYGDEDGGDDFDFDDHHPFADPDYDDSDDASIFGV